MRHRVKGRKLKRTSEHRLATLRNLATSLLRHKKIRTTVAKAKELRSFVEPIINKAKMDSVAARRYVAAEIHDRAVVSELFGDIALKIADRKGGYTRVVKLGQRKGDGADMAIIELVDYSGVVKPKASKKEKAESETPKEEAEKKEAKPKAKKAPKKKEAAEEAPAKKTRTKKSAEKE